MSLLLAAALACLAAGPARAADLDDSDLSEPLFSARSSARLSAEGRRERRSVVFPLITLKPSLSAGPADSISGSLVLVDRNGTPKPARLAKVKLSDADAPWTAVDPDGGFRLPAAAGRAWRLRVSLDNKYWSFRSEAAETYEWESDPVFAGTDIGTLSPPEGSEHSKLAVLHLTYLEALDLLRREASTAWWKETLTVVWPGGADYFSSWNWSLRLTNPLAWDIALHELGHAVMHGALNASMTGGSHKIDECYSGRLAWSEGWASFFAAAVHLSPDDADAKFEFMVPRRAPIRVENVPGDVCRGPRSEWRVFAGLWDLYDGHADGESAALGFGPIWNGVTGGVTSDVVDAWRLIARNLDPVSRSAAEEALRMNTLLPARAAPARTPRLPRSAGRLFDGTL